MTESEFELVLKRSEGETLDFKAAQYDLKESYGKYSLVKDVLSMANTPRDHESLLVIGVKKHSDGNYDLWGCGTHPDEADLQSQFTERVHPLPTFSYEIFSYKGKSFGLLRIPPVRIGPCVAISDYGESLRRVQVYFRRGSKNDAAGPEDLPRILSWFEKRGVAIPITSDPSWDLLLEKVQNFESSRLYILVCSRLDVDPKMDITPLAFLPWLAAFDFDPRSDESGLLSKLTDRLQERRNIHLVTLRDRPTFNLRAGAYWHFPAGLSGRDSLDISKWQNWQRSSGSLLNDQLKHLSAACDPRPVTAIVIWRDLSQTRFLRTTLEGMLANFGDLLTTLIVTDQPSEFEDLAKDVEATLVEMPLHHFCSGVTATLGQVAMGDSTSVSIPSSSGAPLIISPKDQRWLEEEFEIINLESGQVPAESRSIGRDFLQGSEISWYELGVHSDVERDLSERLERQIRNDLAGRKTARINLYHAPGAGGTTVAKRMIWDFHRQYPSLLLKSTKPSETAERIAFMTSSSGHSVLIAVDGADVVERDIDELYDQLRARNVPAVILQVVRRFTMQSEGPRSFYLKAELSLVEAQRFRTIFGKEQPGCVQELDRLLTQTDARFRSAFYFGLVAFGQDFKGLESYVNARISSLSDTQKRILGFIAIAHHYGQKALPGQAFAGLLGFPRSRSVRLPTALSRQPLDLLVTLGSEYWRTAHDLIAVELIQQLLWPSAPDRRLWKQQLSRWAIDFAEFCRGDAAVNGEEMLEIARRVFVYRDNSELLGTERSGLNQFAQIIEEIPSKEGALEVLRALTELYPDEPHFWAHLGRFYSLEKRDFPAAVECLDHALALQDRDHVLHHMKGMAYRQHVYSSIDRDESLDQIVDLAEKASKSFEQARAISPEDDHGYISEVQMLTRVLEYAGRKHSGGILSYMSSPQAEPYLRQAFERSEDLLERVRRNREGQGASPYEEKCRGQLDVLYGRHDRALQVWDNLLTRKDIYAPPVRRQAVWTYLARKQRSWYDLEEREITRIIRLLEDNLREEPQVDTNLRLWVQAVRRGKNPPTTDAVIEQVGYWRSNANSLESVFYSYVLYALQSIEGSTLALDPATRFIEESRTRTRFNRNRNKSLEWLGKGSGVNRLVHHGQLGNWDRNQDFWENTALLTRVQGRISRIDAPQSGEIEVEGGLKAFFVPARGGYNRGRSENQAVSFYLGFSYEGLRAWEVKSA